MISKNGLEGQQSHNIQEVKMQHFERQYKFEVNQWYGVGRVTWTIINWGHWIYNGTVRKMTQNNPNSLVMSCVSISQFYSGIGWDKLRKLWHAICDCNILSSLFLKQQSRYCIKRWRGVNHWSILNHLDVKIQDIIIMFWVE